MKKKKQNKFSPAFKANIVIQLLRGEDTAAGLSLKHGIGVATINGYKKAFLANAPAVFEHSGESALLSKTELEERVHELSLLNQKLEERIKTMAPYMRTRNNNWKTRIKARVLEIAKTYQGGIFSFDFRKEYAHAHRHGYSAELQQTLNAAKKKRPEKS